ncbi:MAG: hypothetical protein LBU73_06005 [Helicobacteraceae bacterium]|jgi:hypothetical protein|nr:hypothetical protein [Helicobacteraceae bacterium]
MKNLILTVFGGVFALVLVLVLASCGRSAFFDFTGSAAYADALPHTKRAEIIDKFESRALITASYLNAIYPEDKNYSENETFLIGLYIANDFTDKQKQGINNPNYTLALGENNYISAEKVDKNDHLLKIMPLVNRWNHYYIVRFPIANELILTLTDRDFNQSVSIDFAKSRKVARDR